MKSDRLLSVLLLLQARGRATERELAERLEVSQRTIHRDLESLSASGVPVLALRGSRGGWELAKGWRTQVPGLNAPELQALLMAQPRVLGHPRLAAAAESAMNKLLASLPGTMRQQAAEMRDRLHVDPRGWWESGEDLSVLPLLQDSVANQRSIAFDYARADGQTGSRKADPFGLVAKGVTWYLVANTSAGMRTFRVSRMANATVLASAFERPARFDLAAYWARTTAELEQSRGMFSVVVAAEPKAAQRIRMHCRAMTVEPTRYMRDIPEGWEVLRVDFEEEMHARFVVLGLGALVRILDPQPFRRSIAAEIRQMTVAAEANSLPRAATPRLNRP